VHVVGACTMLLGSVLSPHARYSETRYELQATSNTMQQLQQEQQTSNYGSMCILLGLHICRRNQHYANACTLFA
jgi:hypothetical protein